MDITTATSAMRSSLLTRDVYAVCFPERDDLESLHGEKAFRKASPPWPLLEKNRRKNHFGRSL